MIYEQEHSIFDKNSLYNKFKSIDTSFEVTNGKISAIISDAEIEEYVDGSKTMYSRLNSRISTVEGYKEQISSIQTQVDSDGESINQITSKITEIEASDSEYRISTNETISGIQDDMSGLSDRVSNAEVSLQPDNIVLSARKSSLYSSDLNTATNNAVNTTKSWAQSELQIRDDSIAACVKESDVNGNYVVGKINLNSTTAKIQARNIDLEGQLTVSAFNQDTQSIINSHDMRFFTTNYAWTQAQIDNVSDIGHVTTWTVNEAVDTVAVGNTVMLSLLNTTKNITSYIMATVTQIYSVANKQIRCKFIGVLEKGIDGIDGKDGTNGKDGATGATGPQGPAGKDGVDGKDGKDGTNGTPATVYDLIVSSSVVNKNVSGVYNPTTLTLTAQKIVGNGSPTSYSGRFKIETTTDGSSWVTNHGYTSSSDQSSYTYTIPAGIKALRCSLYLAGGTTTLLDQQTVPIVSDGLNGTNGKDGKDGTNGTNGVDGKDGKDGTNGTNGVDGKDAYTVILTNENHTFAGGTAAALGGSAECSVIAYKGVSQIPVRIGSITGLPSSGMTVAISNNNTVSAKFTVTVNTEMVSKNGVLTVPITVDGKSFSKKFTYSLALEGAKGDTGFQGVSIVSTQMQYYLSTSNTSQTDGSWQDAPPAYVEGRYYWERAKTTLNDPSKSGSAATLYAYSTAVLSRGLNTAIANAKTAQDAADAVDAIIRDWASANDTTLIDGAKIYTGTVTTDKLAARAITAEKIASEAIMANHLRADTLVGKELYVTDISGRTGWTTTMYYRNSASSTMNDRIANRDNPNAGWKTSIPAYQASYPYLWAYAKIGDYKSIPVCVAKRSSATSYTWYHNVNVSEGRIWSAMNDCYIMFDSISNVNKPERLAMISSEGEVSVGKYNADGELSAGDASVNILGKKKVHIQSNTEVSIVSMNDVSITAGDNKALHVYGDIVIHRGTIRYDNDELSS